MSLRELGLVRACDVGQLKTECVGSHSETPEDVPKLFGETRWVDVPTLKYTFSNEPEQLGGFFSQAGGCVEESIARVERRVDRAQRPSLILV